MTRKNSRSTLAIDIWGIILITIGFLSFISVFLSKNAGFLGKFVHNILFFLIGVGAFAFPFIVVIFGVFYIAMRGAIKANSRFYGMILFIFSIMLITAQYNISYYFVNNNFIDGFKLLFDSQIVFNGGAIGYLITVPIYMLIGKVGTYIVFCSLLIISLMLVFQISIYEIAGKMKKSENKESTKKEIHKSSSVKNHQKDKSTFLSGLNNKMRTLNFIKTKGTVEEDVKSNDDLQIENIGYEETSRVNDCIVESKKEDTRKENTENNEEMIKEVQKQVEQNEDYKSDLDYTYPPVELLDINKKSKINKNDKRELIVLAGKLEETLSNFGVDAKVVQVTKGPSVTRYELQPSPGVKVSRIVNLADDIALNLAASGVRIEAPIPGKSVVGIEVPNREQSPVYLREVIESSEFQNTNKDIAFCLGKDIAGNCVVTNLSKMPHLLIAGATGSGKSVCINTLIISIIYKYSPENVKLLLIDPKVVELSIYNGIPHLLIPVVTDCKKAASALNWAVNEMTRRYKLFADNNVRNVEGYNELFSKGKVDSKLPLIVMVIDELADLMMVSAKDVEDYIGRLAQMARAAGMHLVIATQRPSVDVITGVIKANIPSRISFAVSSQIDSRTILDMSGAEKLLGRGDMLFYPLGENKPVRVQGAFVSEDEVERIVEFIKLQSESVEYKKEIIEEIENQTDAEVAQESEDELYDEAVTSVIELGQASTSLLQRKLRIGYNRAARLIDEMEEKGIISKKDGSKPRQILKNKNNEV